MEPYYWDQRIDYLAASRYLMMNDDYLEFLIKAVWKWKEPVHLVDFGCGLGYLGLKFLPHLPQGSTYTGIDKGEKLILKAKENFKALPYTTEFILGDFTEMNVGEQNYDAAVCQAVLMHLPKPKETLEKMIRSVKQDGQVICIEPHWISAMANTYVHEMKQSEIVNLGILQKLYELDAERTGKDGNIGTKLPVYMKELGLNKIGCRISDCVRYLHPDLEEEKQKLYTLIRDEGFAAPVGDEVACLRNLMDRGLSLEEAQAQVAAEKYLHEHYSRHGLDYHTLFAPTMMISYGTKSH